MKKVKFTKRYKYSDSNPFIFRRTFESIGFIAMIRNVGKEGNAKHIPEKGDKVLYFNYPYLGNCYDFVIKLLSKENGYETVEYTILQKYGNIK